MLKPLKILLFAICYGLFFLPVADAVCADTANQEHWLILETKYTKIFYLDKKDLEAFYNKVDFSTISMGLQGIFTKPDADDFTNKVKQKVDAVYERVQEILDMRKPMDKININIYPDEEKLHAAYTDMFQQDCQLRSWYIYEKNTVYINASDMHEGILAHEMAHGIIDHFLSVRPPAATAEILARYVDGHLFN